MKRGGAIKSMGKMRMTHSRSPEQRFKASYNRIIVLLLLLFAVTASLAAYYGTSAAKNRAAAVEYASEMYMQAEKLYKSGNAVEAMDYLNRWFEMSERFGIKPEPHQAEFYQLVSSAAEAGMPRTSPVNRQSAGQN